MKKKDLIKINDIDETIQKSIADGIDSQEIKDKIEEYVEVCKVKEKIAQEIMELFAKKSKSKRYVSDLVDTIKQLKEEGLEAEEEE